MLFKYNYDYNTETGQKTKFEVFSALDCECTHMDFDAAIETGTIQVAEYDALIANMYKQGVEIKKTYWLDL